jgi:hypothetical protein
MKTIGIKLKKLTQTNGNNKVNKEEILKAREEKKQKK